MFKWKQNSIINIHMPKSQIQTFYSAILALLVYPPTPDHKISTNSWPSVNDDEDDKMIMVIRVPFWGIIYMYLNPELLDVKY